MIAANKEPNQIRCAIYTRKSTTEGLEQEFNSLDAQRESGAAYIASQRHEGWIEVETPYNDGGFTGGNMDRPAIKRLLSDIAAGKIDCVIVYKVDRLSRSLLDFSRIMETFDEAGVSFVSVTQQFNTTSSMGRLTLNILLSFAQFEREIISERTRDKMHAARRKGKFIGGRPVLGYDLDRETKRLVVNDTEATRVQQIFDLYLESEGLMQTVDAIHARGWRTKLWTTKSGKSLGGVRFNKNGLHSLLTNRIYLGQVAHHDEIYEGEHDAIVDEATFKAVQKKLRSNRINAGDRVHGRSQGVLAGLIRCTACDSLMTHSSSRKRGKVYRYYVCNKATKRGRKTCPRASLPADQVERFVIAQLQSLTIDESLLNETCHRVRTSLAAKQERLQTELTSLNTDIYRIEQAINALATASEDPERESVRLESVASLDDQLRRDQKRRTQLKRELDATTSAAPSRMSILKAIKDLETLWEHLTIPERSRLVSTLIENIDHDPTDSSLSITLSATGLQSFGTQTTESAQ
ncbi:MAG: recombinase family protein [Planctomycetota bacterium]